MGNNYLRCHPWGEYEWFSERWAGYLQKLRHAGIKVGSYVPPAKMDQVLSTLTPREEKIIRMRFGIGEKKEYSLEEPANVFGLSVQTISDCVKDAKVKLLHPARAVRLTDDFKKRLDGI